MRILSLTPAGSLQVVALEEGSSLDIKLLEPFAISQSAGLFNLVASKPNSSWPAILWYWRNFIALHITELCHIVATESQDIAAIAVPSAEKLELLVTELPPMLGAEYCNAIVLTNIWVDFDTWLRTKIKDSQLSLKDFLTEQLPLWQQVGRVCFHLAENKQDPDYPFAFLVTYAGNLSHNAKVQYKPISKALQEYAGSSNKKALANLLQPIYHASKTCPWVQELLASNDLYHPLAWEAAEAYALLQSIAKLEDAGLIVHLPNWWQKRVKPQVKVTIGGSKQSAFGATELLDFNIAIALDGTPLSEQELQEILTAEAGLLWLRGQWIEVDRDKLQEALAHWQQVEQDVAAGGLSFIEGMRLLSGTDRELKNTAEAEITHTWSTVEATQSLQQQLAGLRDPALLKQYAPGKLLKATLRPYQSHGSNWLYFLTELGLGACLADDMGLGKTIQVIALLLIKKKKQSSEFPSLIVLPASLLANWQSELQRFAPSLKVLCYHAAELSKKALLNVATDFTTELAKYDIVLTTYGMLLRQEWLLQQQWNLVVLDEAQAIKNPGTRQTKAVKQLQSKARIALTGTPIENRLGDLWSLFDFICPGLLGSSNRFKIFLKTLEKKPGSSFAPLRQLVQPYILRRLKTDKNIISDLPDKTEVTAWCGLSR
ncbi:MAG: ATP-dependent helicase, partial [Thiotrichales bacterium]